MVGGFQGVKMEIFDTDTGTFCTASLELPEKRYGHTIGKCELCFFKTNNNKCFYFVSDIVDGKKVICGGGSTGVRNTCIRLTNDNGPYTWEHYADLPRDFDKHSSWVMPSGKLLLLGNSIGSDSDNFWRGAHIVGEGDVSFLTESAR